MSVKYLLTFAHNVTNQAQRQPIPLHAKSPHGTGLVQHKIL